MLYRQTFGSGADFATLGGVFSSCIEEMRERNSHFKLFCGMSFERVVEKYAGRVAEYRASEHKTMKV